MVKQTRNRKVDKDTELSKIRHSAGHVLAEAVLNLYPDTKLGIGPSTENGFYYDFEFAKPLTDDDLPKIESEMIRLLKEGRKFKKSNKTIAAALAWAKKEKQPYKIDLIKGLKKDGHKKVTFYKSGNFIDLCEGPHVKDSKEIKAFKILSLAGAYWRGDENNSQLTRIYGTAFSTNKELIEYLYRLEEAKKRDHRILGEQFDLFSFHPEGPGFPFWHHKGLILFNQILGYMRGALKKNGYQEISTPILLNKELWKESGHWDNYKENMYFTEIDKKNYAIRPMNCPGNILVYKNTLHSYRDLPLRLAEFGLVHRHELSGVLHGLFRVRSFTQDDAHIYCTPDQIKDEIKQIIELITKTYKDFGFDNYRVELSTRPKKSIGSSAIWKTAEQILKQTIKEAKLDFEINEGDGAFYGPKIDFHVEDSLGRSWQLGTIQLDFFMPERLKATYIDRDGKKKTPIMIHRTVLGSLERFIGILIEHYAGALPYWLAPIQASILTISEKQVAYAKNIATELNKAGIRVVLDDRNESLGKKIRDTRMQKIWHIIVIGPKEVKTKTISLQDPYKDFGNKSLKQAMEKITGFYDPKE